MAEENQKIENPTSRLRAFSRRRNNLIKKANRLVQECGVEVAVVVISPSGHIYHFSSDHSNNIGSILERYISLPLETRYANDPKLKEKQNILAQLEPIHDIENKCLYLDLQTSCLEKQLHISKIERDLTDATLRNFEVDPTKDPSTEQLNWCEENLMRSLSRLAEKKHELIMKELTMSLYQSSSVFSNKRNHINLRQALPDRSASSLILTQLDPWISPFSTKIRESILKETRKGSVGGSSIPYRSENSLIFAGCPSLIAQAQSNNFLVPSSAQMFGLKMGGGTDFPAMFDQFKSIVLPPAHGHSVQVSYSTQSLNEGDEEDHERQDYEFVAPEDFISCWHDDAHL
ncbi:hypothetical protein QQ045_017746 [Rhodiola kirilowii]